MSDVIDHAEIDFNGLAWRILALRDQIQEKHYDALGQAFRVLRQVPFPPGYIDSLHKEALQVLRDGEIKQNTTHVYLAFYGLDGRASHLKVGVARDVQNRMSTIKTGNPLPNLWTYAAAYRSRKDAMSVESAILASLAQDAVHGEWVKVHGLSEQVAEAMVESLSEVAYESSRMSSKFIRCTVRV